MPRRLAAALSLLVLLAGCAGRQQLPVELSDGSAAALPPAVQLAVPFHPQTAYHCGPAALASTLNFRGVAATPEQLAPEVYTPGRRGSLLLEVGALPRRYGQLSYPLAPQLQALLRELAAGNPVLVLQNLGFNWWPQWHYAVAVGYDLERGELLLHSGVRDNYRLALDTFVNTWRRGGHWGRVILPPGELPAGAEPLAYVRALGELEQGGWQQAALEGYRAAAARWPEAFIAQFALGNAALAQGDYLDAVAYLQQSLALQPDSAAAWNNLGFALQGVGCDEQAQAAVARAVTLAPDEGRYRDSLLEVSAVAAGQRQSPAASCGELATSLPP